MGVAPAVHGATMASIIPDSLVSAPCGRGSGRRNGCENTKDIRWFYPAISANFQGGPRMMVWTSPLKVAYINQWVAGDNSLIQTKFPYNNQLVSFFHLERADGMDPSYP